MCEMHSKKSRGYIDVKFDPCDISSFLLVFSVGPCTGCGL